MSTEYIKTNWQDGDIITAGKMNNIENGIKGLEQVGTELRNDVDDLADFITVAVGSPLVANTVAEMTDTKKIYVYTGSETGYTNGNWYYYDGTNWQSGGTYNSTAVTTDKTLTNQDVPADAKAVGEELTNLKADLSDYPSFEDYVGYKLINLFDKSTAIANNRINTNTGELNYVTITHASDYIEVEPNKSYLINFTYYSSSNFGMAFYDEQKTFIVGMKQGESSSSLATDPFEFVAPPTAKYIRITITNENVDSAGVYSLDVRLNGEVNNSVHVESNNVYSSVGLTSGYVAVDTGTFASSDTTKVTDYLPVIGNKYIVSAFAGQKNEMFLCAVFDSEKAIIPEALPQTGDGKQRSTGYFKLPSNAKYVRVTFANNKININNKLYLLDTVSYTPTVKYIKYLVKDDNSLLPFSEIVMKENVNELVNEANQKSKRFYGAKVVAFGDSITNGGAWFNGIKDFFGSTPVNLGVAGATVTTNGHDGFCTDDRINTIPLDTDVLLVMGGVNDWVENVNLGNKELTNTDTTTFYGAVNVMLQKINTRVPNARIICMGTTFGIYPNKSGFIDTSGIYNNLDKTTIDYGRAFADMCGLNGVESFVIGEYCGWNQNNIATYVTNDGAYLHPNSTGGARMADVIKQKIG